VVFVGFFVACFFFWGCVVLWILVGGLGSGFFVFLTFAHIKFLLLDFYFNNSHANLFPHRSLLSSSCLTLVAHRKLLLHLFFRKPVWGVGGTFFP